MILSKVIEENAKRYPKKIAICFKRVKITYQELNSRSNRLSQGLKGMGIKKGDIVALLLPNVPEFVVSYFAVVKLGAVVLPLNPSYKQFELRCFLPNATTSAIITTEEIMSTISSLRGELPFLKGIIVLGKKNIGDAVSFESVMRKYSLSPLREKILPSDAAVLLYTSGVTSQPKGAVLTHDNLLSNVKSIIEIEKIKKDDAVLCALPLFHSFAMTVCMLTPLLVGAKIVLVEKFIPHMCIEAIRKFRANIFLGVPTMFAYLLNQPGIEKKYFSSLSLCLSGGAALSVEIARQFKEKFNLDILEGYGLTEASPVVCYNSSSGLKKMGSVGMPVPGVEVKIIDEKGEETKTNEVGEILVRGKNVMKEYYNNPAATQEVIKDGWLYTGDLGKKDEDGYFYIVGRKKEIIIVSGFNVYPQEVEDCLLSHPEVQEAAVVGKYDKLKGEAIKAYIVLRENSEADYEEIMEYCKEKLAPHKVPRYLEFKEMLPKSDTGKILKKELV